MKALRTLAALVAAGAAIGYATAPHRALSIHEERGDRGRDAVSPTQMTWVGWRDVVLRTWSGAMDDHIFTVAASVAFYCLLAFVPALSVLVSLYGLFGDPGRLAVIPDWMDRFLPGEAVKMVQNEAMRLAGQPGGQLSINLFLGVALSLWSASAAAKSLFDALNLIYEEREKRSFLVYSATALAVTLLGTIFFVLAIVAIGATPGLLALAELPPAAAVTFDALRWPLFGIFSIFALAVLYWLGPSRRPARFTWLLPGATAAAIVWSVGSAGFSWYANTLAHYSATYGSLAAVVILMTWLWLSASVVLLGAQLNSELEHQTARDTTMGPEKPIGLRGARMADRIGRAV